MNKNFITFGVAIIAFFLGVVCLTYKGKTDGLDLLSIVIFLFTGAWGYARKFGSISKPE